MKKLILTLIIAVSFSVNAKAATENELAAKVENYLNSLSTLSADFTQVDAEGNAAGGKFMLKRPGKFRWEYDMRQPLEIVSDGKQLVYYDKKLKEATYTSLQNSLAGFLARKNIKLSGDVQLVSIEDKNGMVRAKVKQKEKPEEGALTMFFNSADMKIAMLEVEDAGGGVTKIMFSNQQFGQKIDDKTFFFRDPKFNKNAWER